MSYFKYAFETYGPLANRPTGEIIRHADKPRVTRIFGWTGHRYANNSANQVLGFCRAERAVWLASIQAKTDAELVLAWGIEITLARTMTALSGLTEVTP